MSKTVKDEKATKIIILSTIKELSAIDNKIKTIKKNQNNTPPPVAGELNSKKLKILFLARK